MNVYNQFHNTSLNYSLLSN